MRIACVFIGLLYCISAFVCDTERKKNREVLYLLLDRNSPGIEYHESGVVCSLVDSVGKIWEIVQVNESNADEDYWRKLFLTLKKNVENNIERKSLSFLKTINCNGERWVKDSLMYWKGNEIYLLDKGTIEKDSILMYRVDVVVEEVYICE